MRISFILFVDLGFLINEHYTLSVFEASDLKVPSALVTKLDYTLQR